MPDRTVTRWSSFENPTGEKGKGGTTNRGAKGAAFQKVSAGETVVLMEAAGSGTVRRIWMTLSDRSPKALRSYVLRMYWDNSDKPAVEVPLGDFFGAILGEMRPFEAELFSSPEGRSLNSTVPMPFRTAARITFTNESDKDLRQLFYDVNYTLGEEHPENSLYFHASWSRQRWTELAEDFEILPVIEGRGRFLGTHVGIIGHPDNVGWWGEGEVKIYLDGDTDLPTLVGTGTEDYVGTAYGQGEFSNRYQGSILIDNKGLNWTFYRHHIPDPIFFHSDIRVTIQQMGGASKKAVLELLEKGVQVQPISVHNDRQFVGLMEGEGKELSDESVPEGWTNMYRRDDVSAVALFYLDKPANQLPAIAPLSQRIVEEPESN
jgi:hypothetical protein